MINIFFKKKGDILVENVLFIIINIAFIVILILFLTRQSNNVAVNEQTTAKQIALVLDSAKPGMEIKINMDKLKSIAEDNKFNFNNTIKITDNIVRVQLTNNTGYEYSFFNNVKVICYGERDSKNNFDGIYVFNVYSPENKK